MPWSSDDERKLLMAIIATNDKTPNWDEIALIIGKTREASRQHYQKLKREFISEGGHEGDHKNKTPPKTLPRKDGHPIQSESGGERAAINNGKPAVSKLGPKPSNSKTPEPTTKTLPRKRGTAELVKTMSSSDRLARMKLVKNNDDEEHYEDDDDDKKSSRSTNSIKSTPSTPKTLLRKRGIAEVVKKPSVPSKRARMILDAVEGEDYGGPGAGLNRSGRPSRLAPKPNGALLLRDEFFDREIVDGEEDGE